MSPTRSSHIYWSHILTLLCTFQDLQYALVLDTNILMDHLTLLDDLFPQIRHNNLKLALMVPRVVINELDNLKTNGGSQEKRSKAQNANRWLATRMQPGQRYLRGQKSTKAPSGRLSVSVLGSRWIGVARFDD
jgi:predicted ribonuclease YlaK